MRVALTGVSGFIGSVTARHLVEAGHTVNGLVRSTSRRDHIEPYVDRFVVGEQSDESAWPALLEDCDCVIHNSVDWRLLKGEPDVRRHFETNLMGSLMFLEQSAPRQFIFVSTIAVHHDMRPRWNGTIDEDHPLRPANLYGAYKAAVEAHLWAAHFGSGRHTSAVRPCGVYGIDPTLDRSIGYPIIEKVRAGQAFARQGGGKFVHVEDVAAALVALIKNDAAAGKAYNLVDCYARWADWAHIVAEALGVDPTIDDSSPATPKNTFDMSLARKDLGLGLDRGMVGIREHIHELIAQMPVAEAAR